MRRALFDEDHEAFREAVRVFVERRIRPYHQCWREEGAIPRECWREAGRHDFLGISMPIEDGGAGAADFRFNVVLTEELAQVGLGLASSFGIHTDVVAPYLSELASEEQRRRWIPRFCSGEMVTAIAMTEPGAGSDLASLQTRARRERGRWVLDGSKTFITNGIVAGLVIVAARTGERRREITLFAVEEDMPGFQRGRKLHKIGQPEVDTAELFFEHVEVPDENVLGPVHGGFAAMIERLPQERLHTACANIAHAAAQLSATLEYVKERRAFGRPIGTFQHSRFALAEMVTAIDVTQAYVDRCVAAHVEGELTAVDAAKAKWWSAEVQNRVIDECVQLHGGYGYMDEYPVARAYCDARVTRIWAGSNEIMKEMIGRSLGLGDPRGT